MSFTDSPTTPSRPPDIPSTDTASPAPRIGSPKAEPPDQARTRFLLELEFVQCLANPQYLQFLAHQQYFNDPAFLNYLAYLRYWQQPQYAKYIVYPYCLHILDLLQHAAFRSACSSSEFVKSIHDKEFWHWKTYRKNRMLEEHRALEIPVDLMDSRDVFAGGGQAASPADRPALEIGNGTARPEVNGEPLLNGLTESPVMAMETDFDFGSEGGLLMDGLE
ncbi:mediator complex subunit SOH1 [Spizellomyces punctatus DAOM BR117]|uniref:Mediator of RNA polymerase II transcription subunit 31 n=1 Tax=Spizellomyces punctatus (strain DAOM BR117) TaxID=645134 RepID=A0A0L0HFY4_SPIPD|nr:mediator complex subunit SOH1 [Spizellomyces punctatus DAOM BR117]KND00401.1 hypothetical protein SPPG_04724 [Spizellomyces punctatus DAOM BR117]|eukprot:XP_016608440.1 hypothetical protein SPPG_04724 [Spizellomyces punctatus DAOM BR117]